MTAFPHLHVRSIYSPLRSLVKLRDLAKAQAGSVAAVTDRGGLWAAARHQRACEAAGTRPVFGAELAPEGARGHVVVLARGRHGWRTLSRLVSRAAGGETLSEEDVFGAPDCVVLSGGAGGDLDAALAAGDLRARLRHLSRYDSLCAEVAPTMPRWREVADAAADAGVRVVATGDVSYLRPDGEADLRLLRAIATGERWDGQAASGEGWLRSDEDMRAFFASVPEAVDAAHELAAGLTARLDLGTPRLPRWPDAVNALRSAADAGLRDRLRERSIVADGPYWDRLRYELSVIEGMDFCGYFLIVGDFMRWARSRGIALGPGRGSAAGSLVVWALGITELDPIASGLFFERFLNPERAAGLPDIDVDVCTRRRSEVVAYLASKYGEASVGRLTTFMFLHGKKAIKDAARALGVGFARINELTSRVPGLVGGKAPSVAWIAENDAGMRDLMLDDPVVATAVAAAARIEGVVRDTSIHASGVVISDGDLWMTAPTARDARGELVCQYDMVAAEDAGLVKMDVLGLSNVTQLEIGARSAGVDLAAIPLDDPAVYCALADGDTHGVFQMCGRGFRRMLGKMRPDAFGDVVAAGALYRPGPLESGMTDAYTERKNGRAAIEALHPALDEILSETYGCVVYQEQVMAMVRALSGCSAGRADIIRKIMGKKKPELLAKEERLFLADCARHGVCDEATARKAWAVVETNSGYSFNKSHSAAYGLISYRTAWLKVHHAAHFYASLLTIAAENADKRAAVALAVDDMRKHGVELLPPVVGVSGRDFVVEGGAVRFGLGGLWGLGRVALDKLLADPPRSLAEAAPARLGKRAAEALARSGALDHLLPRGAADREAVLAWDPEPPRRRGRGASAAQVEMFPSAPTLPRVDTPEGARLAAERRYTGVYLSGHPLDGVPGPDLRVRLVGRETALVPVIVDRVFEKKTKSGEWMAIVYVQDRRGCEELPCFARAYARLADTLEAAVGRVATLTVAATRDGKLHVDGVRPVGWAVELTGDTGTALSDFVVLDVETTGLSDGDRSPRTQRVVEVGVAEFVARGHRSSYGRLVDPGIPISAGSQRVHGITDEMVRGAPRFAEVAPRLGRYLENRVVLTYNGTRFDVPVLRAEFERVGVPFPPCVLVDVFSHARNRYNRTTRPASKKLGDQCAFFGVEVRNAHRAADDAEATGRLILRMQDEGCAPLGIDALVAGPPDKRRKK